MRKFSTAAGIMTSLLLVAVTVIALPVTFAQGEDEGTVTDGHFQVEVPQGWTNQSTDDLTHFVSPDGKVDLYLQSVETEDAAAAKQTVLTAIAPDFSATPVQSNEVPLPGGATWTQDVYSVDGELWAALSTVKDGYTYVIAVKGEQTAFIGASQAINNLLFNFKFVGDAPEVLPDYIDQSKFTEQEVSISYDKYELPATLTMPITDNDLPVPAVILVSGSGPENRDEQIGPNKPFRDIAWGLASNGIAVLRYDDVTFVYGRDIDPGNFTLDDESVTPTLHGIELLRTIEGIDPDHIYVLGHSLGAMAAPRIGEQDSGIAGLILMSGNARPFEVVVADQIDYLKSLGTPDSQLAGLQPTIDWLTALRNNDEETIKTIPESQISYLKSLVEYDQVATAQSLTMPMLVLQGERDYQVTMEDFGLWQDALQDQDNVTFHSYPNLNHLMMTGEGKQKPEEIITPGYVDGEVIADIVDWINSLTQ